VSFEDRLELGEIGEHVIDEFLRQHGWVPYWPEKGKRHPFDRLAASADKRKLCIVEVKTKYEREAYPDTGINLSCFSDYQNIEMQYGVPIFLVFVDARKGQVYGNWWADLLKSREPEEKARRAGCLMYPWTQKGIVYFQTSPMKILHVIPKTAVEEIRKRRISNWKENGAAS